MQLKRNRQSEDGTGKGRPETPVPQNILDCVRSALSPYITSWDKVQDAIMSSGTEDQLTDTEEETFLSTEDVSKMLHVSRTTLHRYKTAGKIRVFKLGRRNLYSSKEIRAALKNATPQVATADRPVEEAFPEDQIQLEF